MQRISWGECFGIGILVMIVLVLSAYVGDSLALKMHESTVKVHKSTEDLKYLKCVSDMQKAIPDPNDTEGRAEFLKNYCYE